MKVSNLLPLIMLLFITSCAKEFDEPMIIEDDIVINAPVFIETSLFVKISGFSADESLDAICMINEVEYKPDVNGFLYIPSILMNEVGQLVKVEAEGFMPGIYSVIPSIGDVTQLKIMVTKTRPVETFDALDVGTFSIGDSEYIIPALSIIDANGDNYLGTVDVHSYIRQSAQFASLISTFSHNTLIGDDGKNYSLQTWGGHDIFLYDVNGNEVFIKKEVKIQARLEIRSIENNVIPSELDVMRFNEVTNKWELDSVAKLDEDRHIAEISDFGHLLWSKKIEVRRAKVKFTSDFGPLESFTALLFIDESIPISISFSNDKGDAYVYIPVDGDYYITAVSFCGGFFHNTFEEVNNNQDELFTLKDFEGFETASKIKGRIVDCNGDVVPFGVFEIPEITKFYFIADENGFFTIQYFLCEQKEISGRVYNPITQEFSEDFKFEYIPNTIIDLEDKTACQ